MNTALLLAARAQRLLAIARLGAGHPPRAWCPCSFVMVMHTTAEVDATQHTMACGEHHVEMTNLPSRPTAAGRGHTYLKEHKRADDNVLA